MDFSVDAITKSLIWYIVPGLALVFFFFFPFLILNPFYAKMFVINAGSFGITFLAIIFGFILDGLRLYRWRPRYADIKKSFFTNLVDTTKMNLDPYYIQSRISDIAKQNKVAGLNFHHAIWIMHGHLSMLAFLEAVFWVLAALYFYIWSDTTCPILGLSISKGLAICIYIMFAALYFLICLRFHSICRMPQ